MDRYDVVVCEDVWGEPFDQLGRELTILADPQLWTDRGRLLDYARTARALVVRNRTQVDAELLAVASHLAVVARAGVGLDNIDVTAADQRGVTVVSPRGANALSVAEYAIGAALALVRQLTGHDAAVRKGQWDRTSGRELAGRTWGILGAGATGLAVARLARALGMNVVGYDPYVDVNQVDLASAGVRLGPLDEVCAAADVLSIHLPSTPDTIGLVDARVIATMRADALLINAGRGDVLDEEALADALEQNRLGGAALDVRTCEPPMIGRLEKLDSILLTPHVAGITAESQARIVRVLADDIRAVLQGRAAANAAGRVTGAGEPV